MRSFLSSVRQLNESPHDSREENPARAVKTAPKPADPLQKNAPAANQAIRIAILRKMNRLEEAEAFTATINQALLSTEEQRLLALERPPPPLESCNSAWVGTNCG